MDDAAIIGGRIRLSRRTHRLTQTELADLAGISERTVRDIEKGTGAPSLASVVGTANVLGLHLVAD